ncbi:MAG TPA: tyrosine-type recombinase/integrase, partial [Acidimicrobiales bacterium]|nr:tyrosine-type recombinase/integrase [Acidimicrobiales bacterium]
MAPPPVPGLTLRRRLSDAATVADALEAWLVHLGAAKPAAATLAGYRRDIGGIAGRLAVLEGHVAATADGSVPPGAAARVAVRDLDRQALVAAFASWAADHAAASVRRAHSAWSGFFDYLVAEGVIEGNPMAAVPKPKSPSSLPRSIRAPGAVTRLLQAAAQPDRRARDPWPARDLALVATFCVTGIREAEAAGLSIGALAGEAGARRMEVKGKGGKVRPVPVDPALDRVLDAYLEERERRFPKEDLDHPATPLFVDVRGRRMTVDQIRYLVEKLYVR